MMGDGVVFIESGARLRGEFIVVFFNCQLESSNKKKLLEFCGSAVLEYNTNATHVSTTIIR